MAWITASATPSSRALGIPLPPGQNVSQMSSSARRCRGVSCSDPAGTSCERWAAVTFTGANLLFEGLRQQGPQRVPLARRKATENRVLFRRVGVA